MAITHNIKIHIQISCARMEQIFIKFPLDYMAHTNIISLKNQEDDPLVLLQFVTLLPLYQLQAHRYNMYSISMRTVSSTSISSIICISTMSHVKKPNQISQGRYSFSSTTSLIFLPSHDCPKLNTQFSTCAYPS